MQCEYTEPDAGRSDRYAYADLGLHRALLMTGIRVAERTIEPVMRLEGLEQGLMRRK